MADDISQLRADIADLQARVARLESQAAPAGLTPVKSASSTGGFGLAALNRIGAVTVAIGVIFFFKYAVDDGLIAAGAGVLLGIVFGAALVAAGDWLSRRGQGIFAQGIAGCGLAALYIAVYASFGFYHLVSRGAGFFALVVVCLAAMTLSVRFGSAVIAALGIAGALLTPLLLHTKASENVLDCVYLLIVAGTGAVIAVKRAWPILIVIEVLMSLLAALAFFDSSPWLFVSFAGALGILHAAVAAWAPAHSPQRRYAYIMAHLAGLSAGLRSTSAAFTNHDVAYEAASIMLACWAIIALTWGLLGKSKTNIQIGLVLLAVVVAKLYVWDVWSLDRIYRITAFLALGGLLLFASWIYSVRRA